MRINRFPRSRQSASPYPATLDLSFLGRDTLDPRITFTRASNATYFDSAGVLQSAANGVSRFDYDPATLALRGFLVESGRTNSLKNSTMVGAVAGTPGTFPTNWTYFEAGSQLVAAIAGVGTDDGIAYVDIRISGTVTAQRSALIFLDSSTATTASQTWTQSLYLKLQAGSLTNVNAINIRTDYYNSTPTFISSTVSAALSVTSAALKTQRRVSTAATPANTALIQPLLRVQSTASGAVDVTIRIGLPQLELGAFVTSAIPTSGSAVARNADVATITTLVPWFNSVEGTLFAEFSVASYGASGQFPAMASLSDGTANNRISMNSTNTGANLYPFGEVSASGSAQAGFYGGTSAAFGANVVRKSAIAYKTNDFAFTAQGLSVQTDTVGTVPTVTTMNLGVGPTGTDLFLHGHLRRVAYYPVRLSNTDLQAITT